MKGIWIPVLLLLAMLACLVFLFCVPIAKADTTLYMDVVVLEVHENKVTFINMNGDTFYFTDVCYPFKRGDKATLEVVAEYENDSFKVITMYYMID